MEANKIQEEKAIAFQNHKESRAYNAAFPVSLHPSTHKYISESNPEYSTSQEGPLLPSSKSYQIPSLLPTTAKHRIHAQWHATTSKQRRQGKIHERDKQGEQQRTQEQQRNINRRLSKHKSAQFRNKQTNNLLLEYHDNILSLHKLGVIQPEIHNISSKNIEPELTEALLMGHKFIPTTKIKHNIIEESMTHFDRSTRLKWFFKDQEDNETPDYWMPNDWYPPDDSLHPTIKSKLNKLAFNLSLMTNPTIHNISFKQRENLKKLLEDPEIIIVTADKNLGYVITDIKWYEQACLDHLLSNSYFEVTKTFYKDGLATHSINEIYNELCTKVLEYTEKFTITHTEAKWICQKLDNDKPFSLSSFYIMPKIHKIPIKGRPIVPSMTWVTFHLSEWIANQLNPLVTEHCPDVLRDSTQLIQNLTCLNQNKIKTFKYTLLSADVVALYPNMDIETGLFLMRKFLENINWATPNRRDFLLWAMDFTLKKGYIYFKGMVFQQTNGAAMGSPMIPPYANIFMHMLEKETVAKYSQNILLYKRFIDDIFLIILNNPTTIQNLQNDLNNLRPFIKLTWTPSSLKQDFLDITIINDLKNSKFQTNIFQKPLNKYSYIPFKSYHTINMKSGFIKGEAIRYVRLCSRNRDFNRMIALFTIRLQRRGYPLHFIKNSIKDIKFRNRSHHIITNNNQKRIPYIFKTLYNPKISHNKLREELNNFSHSISDIPNLPKTLKQKITICYNLPPALHKKILKARKNKGF